MLKNIHFKNLFFSFFLGIAVHIVLIKYFKERVSTLSDLSTESNGSNSGSHSHRFFYESWLRKNGLLLNKPNNSGKYEKLLESKYLAGKVSLLCVIFFIKAQTTTKTFLPHCNKIILVGNLTNDSLHETFPIPEAGSWNGFSNVLPLLFRSKYPKYKWFAFISEETFLIAENLKYFLSILDIKKVHYLGKPVGEHPHGYHSLQAGIVVNRRALKALQRHMWFEESSVGVDGKHGGVRKAAIGSERHQTLRRSGQCHFEHSIDVGLGRCFKEMGVEALETETWKENSFTDIPLGFYLTNYNQNPSIFAPLKNIFIEKIRTEGKVGRHLISFLNTEGVSVDVMKFLVYRWKPWSGFGNHSMYISS